MTMMAAQAKQSRGGATRRAIGAGPCAVWPVVGAARPKIYPTTYSACAARTNL